MSKAPKILGILSIIFGGLVAAWSPLSFFLKSMMKGLTQMASTMPHAPGMRDPMIDLQAAEAVVDAMYGYAVAVAIMYFVMSMTLVVAGAGLLKRKTWGRKLAIGWAALALVIIVAQLVSHFAYVAPLQDSVRQAFYAAHHALPPPGDPGKMGQIMVVPGLLFYAVYPVVLLLILCRRGMADELTA
jgi:hypothetical protein